MADDFDPYYTWLGIPPKDQPPTHYRLLGVELFEANADVIENAADRQIAHIRLFQNGPQGDRSQKLLNEITAAKLCLLNAAKKAEYDEQLRAVKHAADEAARPQTRAVRGTKGQGMAGHGIAGQPAAPADPDMPFDEALDVVSAEHDPVTLPQFPTTGFSVAANEGATTPRPKQSEGRKKLPLLIAGGAVAVLSVVALAWVALRPASPKSVATETGNGTSVEPPPVEPGKKSSIDDVSVSPPGKTPPIEPKTKQPIDSKTPIDPGTAKNGPAKVFSLPTVGFETDRALRFVERDYAELPGTVQSTGPPDSPLTAEMWVRLNPTRQRSYLMGNIAVSTMHSEAPSGIASGWALSYAHRMTVGNKAEKLQRSGLLFQVGGRLHLSANSEMDDGWHHVALCREPTQPDVTYQVFLDGRLVLHTTVAADAQRGSPANLALGCPPYQNFSNVVQTDIACRAFRLSSATRYRGTFAPPAAFEGDGQTLAWLDFSRGQANEVPDRLSPGHPGRVFGGEWMTAEGLLTASGGATNGFFSIDLDRDSTGGKWSLARPTGLPPDQLEVATPTGAAVLRLTDAPPAEYDLDLLVRKREGNGSLAIGLICGGRRVALLCEAADNGNTLLQQVSGRSTSPVYNRRILPLDERVALLIQVRMGRIVVLADGKSILDWRGDVADLQMPASLAGLPIGDGLFLAPQDCSFRFDKLELRDTEPRATPPSPVTYLDDLTEEDASVGWGKLGKHGERGYAEASPKVSFRGRNYTHALSLHPPQKGSSHVTYRLNRQYGEFRATAALQERTDWQKAGAPLVFRVFGDDKLLWESNPLQVHGTGQECSANVRNVSLLKLEIECQGVNHGAHTVWLMPALVRTSGNKAKPKPAKTPSPPAIVKSAPPADAALATLLEEVRKTFGDDYAKAKTADDRLKIADKLFRESSQPSLDAATRYAFLSEARQLAADNGSLSQASAAIDEILAKFDAPPGPLWSDTLGRAVKSAKSNEARREVALACLAQAPLAFRAEQYAAAETMLMQAATLMAQRDVPLVRRARELAKEATEAKDRLTQATAAKETLNANSGDPKAHLTLGKYLCFVKDDWSEGLEHLTKAGEDAIVKLAQRDQAAPTDLKEQEALADAWTAWSKTAPAGFDREGATRRALTWHLKVLQSAPSSAKTRLAMRVEELAGKLAAAESLIVHTPWLDSDPSQPRKLLADQRYVEGISISRDGLLLATSGSEGHKLWHLASGRLLRDFAKQAARPIALSPDGRLLATDQFTRVSVWDTQSGKRLKELDFSQGNGGFLYRLKFSDDGLLLVACGDNGSRGGFAQVWEAKSGRTVRRVDSTTGSVYSAAISPDNKVLAYAESGPADGHSIRLIELATGKDRTALAGRYRRRNDIAFSPDGRRIASAGTDGAYLWNVADGKQLEKLTTQFYESAMFSSDGSRLLLGGRLGVDLRRPDGQLIRHFPRPVSSSGSNAGLAPNGRAAVINSGDGELQIWGLSPDDKAGAAPRPSGASR